MRRRTAITAPVVVPVSVPVPIIGIVAACLIGLGGVLLPGVASAAGSGKISGTVKDASSGEGVENAKVCATPTGGGSQKCEEAGSEGRYSIELEAGSYTVEFTGEVCSGPFDCPPEYASKDSRPVQVEAGKTTEDASTSAELTPLFGQISGRVISGGVPVEGIEVCAFGSGSACTTTNSSGAYTIGHLKAGSYGVEFRSVVSPSCRGLGCQRANFVTQYWSNRSIREESTAVTVEAAKTTADIDAELQVGGHISGRVTNASIYPEAIPGVRVCAYPTATNIEGQRVGERECAYTDAAGEYTIPTLATGGYEVEFTGVVCAESSGGEIKCTHPYVGLIFQGVVSVTAPGTTSGIDGSLLEVSPTKPANTGAPVLTGAPQAGKRLSCSPGSWANRPTSLAYRWLRDGVAIPDQTAATYTVQHADEGYGIACEVIAANGAGATASTSNTLAIPKLAPGVAVVIGVKVHGAKVAVKLGCAGLSACSGELKIIAWVTQGHRRHTKTYRVQVGQARFAMGLGKRLTLHVRLIGGSAALLRRAGRRGLRAQIAGSGVQAHRTVLHGFKRRRY